MRVLYFHANLSEYLADGVFHGLRTLLQSDCVDVPRYDCMYHPLTDVARSKLRGHGFTLYGLLKDLPELPERRFRWQSDLNYYDLIVIADIWHTWPILWDKALSAAREKIIVLDGSDGAALFPYAAHLMSQPWAYFAGASNLRSFKREWYGNYADYGVFARWLPSVLRKCLKPLRGIRPLSFAIPEEKVCNFDQARKVKDFPTHIVDPEIASRLAGRFFSSTGSNEYLYRSEEEYYTDLKEARFGITMKRAGWDCLRHYELAANACILCFRDLDLKPPTCAPHGLNHTNSIIYSSGDDLDSRIRSLSSTQYHDLLDETHKWVRENTTIARAKQLLEACVL